MMEQLQHSLFPLWPLCWYSSNVVWLYSMYKYALLPLQVNCVFLAITLKVLVSRRKSVGVKVTSNKETVKCVNVTLNLYIYNSNKIVCIMCC